MSIRRYRDMMIYRVQVKFRVMNDVQDMKRANRFREWAAIIGQRVR